MQKKKKSLREQARIAGFHTRSIIWSCITMRPFEYSFKKRKMIETGKHEELKQVTLPAEIIPSVFFWNISVVSAATFLFSSGMSTFITLPILAGLSIYRAWDVGSGSAQKTLEKRVEKVQQRLKDQRKQRFLETMKQKP